MRSLLLIYDKYIYNFSIQNKMAIQGFMDWRGNPISKKNHGGVRASLFIHLMITMSSLVYIPCAFNLVSYLHGTMHTDVAKSSTMTTNFIGVTCAFALCGAFLSDSYVTRFKTMLIFGPFEFLGYGILALQAHSSSLKPAPCNTSNEMKECEKVHGLNLAILYIGLYTLALGEGFMRACLASFGGDQFDSDDQIELRQQSSFFNWFTLGISAGSLVGLVFIVWLDSNKGWDYGFGVSALVFLIGLSVMGCGFPLYRNHKPEGSPITRLLQVIVVAIKNRNLNVPEKFDDLQETEGNDHAEQLSHTKGLSFLDKSCITNSNPTPWSQCTVTQIEEAKIIIQMIPIFLIAVINYTPSNLLITFTIQQGNAMNTKLGHIHISPATLFAIPTVLQIVILITYDRLLIPSLRKITNYSNGITQLQRVGVGFIAVASSSFTAALIERKRMRSVESREAMSVLWLIPQFAFLGVTDATAFAGMLEFFNGEASRGMKSLGTAIFWCMLGMASLMGTFLVDGVNRVSRGGPDRLGWVEGQSLNRGRLDRFYWVMFGISGAGFLGYLYVAGKYVYRRDPRVKFSEDGNL